MGDIMDGDGEGGEEEEEAMPSGAQKEARPEEQGCVQAGTCHPPAPEPGPGCIRWKESDWDTAICSHSGGFHTLIHVH